MLLFAETLGCTVDERMETLRYGQTLDMTSMKNRHAGGNLSRLGEAVMIVCLAACTLSATAQQASAQAQRAGGRPSVPTFTSLQNVTVAEPFASKTPCDADSPATGNGDQDVRIRPDGNFNLMFHGNRFVIAKEITAAFEAENPGVRVSYTAVPPINSVRALSTGGKDAGAAGSFNPDVVMGPRWFGDLKDRGSKEALVELRALYSRVHGLVLMGRADDSRLTGDWRAVVKNPEIRVVVPGDQQRQHVLVHTYAAAFGEDGLNALKTSRRVGVSSTKHHRAIPDRIAAKCEDVGLQFSQSRAYWEEQRPGTFKFLDAAASEEDLALEDSYVFTVSKSKQQDLGVKFAKFMTGAKAISILSKYNLQL